MIPLFGTGVLHGQNEHLAWEYFQQAGEFYGRNLPDRAIRELNRSLEFYPDFSESLYLLFRVQEKKQEATYENLSYIDRALESGTWRITDPASVMLDKGRILLRIGMLNDAAAVLEEIQRQGSRTPSLVVLMADLELAKDQPIEAMKLVRSGLAEFPDNDLLNFRFGEIYHRFGMTANARSFFQRMVDLHPNSPEYLWALINSELDEELKIKLLTGYFENGGINPKADMLALDLGAGEPEFFIKRFFENGGGNQMVLLSQLGEVMSDKPAALREAVLDRIVPLTGNRYVDENDDTFYEEMYTYRDGVLSQWTIDRNQDGVAEAVFNIQENVFSSISVHQPEEILYSFDPYPYLRQVMYVDQDSSVLYELANPPIKRLTVQKGLNPESAWPIKRMFIKTTPSVPSRADIARGSYRITEAARSEETPRRIWHLSDGSFVSVTEDRNSDGYMEYGLTFDDAAIWTGSVDLDEDGKFDALEKWVNGELKSIAFDEDQDQQYEYYQLFSDSQSSVHQWDFNEDGIVDYEAFYTNELGERGFVSAMNRILGQNE